MSNLSREREEMLALNRERDGEWVRLVGVEERCRRLEERERVRDITYKHINNTAVCMYVVLYEIKTNADLLLLKGNG